MALELENWEKELISTFITKASSEMKSPKILVFRCQWTYLATPSGEPAPNIHFIDLPCAARVDTAHILEAFQKGIDGILIAACPEEDCHRVRGSQETQHSVVKLKERLGQIGLKERLHFCTVSPRHPEELERELEQFSQQIKGLGKGG